MTRLVVRRHHPPGDTVSLTPEGLARAGLWPLSTRPGRSPVRQFAELRDEIEEIKTMQIVHAISDLAEMKDRNPDEYERLVPKLQEILKAGPARSR